MRKKGLALLLLMALLALQTGSALASVPYRTFTLGVDGNLVQTQAAYEPIRTMTRFGETTLKNPADMRMGPDGNLYIADDGNNRILVITQSGEYVKEIGNKKSLKSAQGVYVDDDLNVFVADEKARAVVVFDQNGKQIREYTKPTDTPLFGESAAFKPNKIVLDKRGNLYIASTGNTNGIVQLSPVGKGEFLGYYGANQSRVTWITAIRQKIMSEEQLKMQADIVPTSVKNLAIDEKGMVYTVSESENAALRRLNVAGSNTLTTDYNTERTTAVAVNSFGSIFTANKDGYIMEYTSEGSTLFYFGASDTGDQRVGTFKSVTGLVVTDDYNIFVLDEILNSVQVMRATEFTDLVHQAFTLFQDGKYAQSKVPWTEVLRMNSLFTYASTGLGEALYREGNFDEALTAFRNGGNRKGYSDAFWELRSDWLHRNLSVILIVIIAAAVLLKVLGIVDRKTRFMAPVRAAAGRIREIPILKQVGWCFTMIRNPFDCSYGIKKEKRSSLWAAAIIVVLFFILQVANKYASGFLFKTVREGEYELLRDAALTFGAFLLLTICCYLVCTIKDGEARFRDIVIGGAAALTPMIIALPIRLILSNVVTFNEEFFLTLLDVVAYGTTGILVILAIMYLNDYTFKKTLAIIVITLFTVLVTVALLFVVYVLIGQLIDFVSSIYGEVVYRFVRKV